MGKKRVATQEGQLVDTNRGGRTAARTAKKKITTGMLAIEATFNNTKAVVSDKQGNVLFWSSSGSLGFKGAKKGTPFAASKVGEVLAEKATAIGIKEVSVVVKGVGSGREPLIRGFVASGIELLAVKDQTPVPHNGPKPKKPRRV
jgi:small subunit ribosomal protein S11